MPLTTIKNAVVSACPEEEDWRWKYHSFEFYVDPKDKEQWVECPECKLTPRVWIFDNGRFAHCVCGKDRYTHTHEVKATPIMEYFKKSGGFDGYDSDELRKNWNEHISEIIK